jgi:hypothetical protein
MMAETMNSTSREHLRAYLDDALSESETSQLEQKLRDDESMRIRLREVMQERDRGDHSVGAIWRRERLTCPTREQLGSYLLEVLDSEYQKYLDFHLNVIACPYCQANLDDMKEHQQSPPTQAKHRRRKYYQSSAGLLQKR